MHRPFSRLALFSLAACLYSGSLRGAEPDSPEKRLREALRNTMLQLRTAETDRAALQAAETENEAKIKDLTQQLDAIKKQAATQAKEAAVEKDKASKTIAGLDAKVTEQETMIGKQKEALDKWKAAYNQAADIARAKESERAKLAGEVGILQGRVNYEKAKNEALFKAGNQILTRYKNYSLGTALLSKEPFTGVMRVKLQNIAQEYGGKLQDGKLKPSDDNKTLAPEGAASAITDKKTAPASGPAAKEGAAKPAPAPTLAPAPSLDQKPQS